MKGISIIIPVYNREMFIGEAIQSVLDQEYNGILEIIISDDGSSDRSLEIAKSFGDNVKIVLKEKDSLSQGASGARNRGLRVATQPYICFLDSDDFYLPDHLNRLAPVLEGNPNLGFAFCRVLYVKEEDNSKVYKQATNQHITKKDVRFLNLSGQCVVLTNGLLIRRSVFDKVGNFNENYSTGEDRDMWMRISMNFTGAFVDHYGAAYRFQHSEKQLTDTSEEIVRDTLLVIFKNAIEQFYQLGLKRSYMIFELKRLFLYEKYGHDRFCYAFKYLNLFFNYPVHFIKRIPSIFQRKIVSSTKNHKWRELSYFTKANS